MPAKPLILLIDDDDSMRVGCSQTLEYEGYRVKTAASGEAGLELASQESFDLVILDLKMPGMDGMEVMAKLKAADPSIIVIVITGYPTIDSAVQAMKSGAYDFLPKPFTPEALLAIVNRAADKKQLSRENICLRLALDERMGRDVIVGNSPAMQRVAELVRKAAPTDSTVLISGETGVGKEMVAKAIHRESGRRNKPFVAVDCCALAETLFESELFGHVKGAYTGAVESTLGKFELANGGTIFLDEIANVGSNIQAKLLRVIQEREVTKVGSTQKIWIDVRIIAATNKDLLKEIEAGRFREDLYYRLNVFPINLPPLRERREDIPILAQYFLEKYSQKRKKTVEGLSVEAMRCLEEYDWPGNVRELENAIELAVIMADGYKIKPCDFLSYAMAKTAAPPPAPGTRLAEIEKQEIIKALKLFHGQKLKTSEYLGISRKTLRDKIQRYKIPDEV